MKRIIVIEREFGAGAGAIADKVARRLGWKLLDHALTAEIAKLAKVSPETCQRREERVDSWLYRLAKVFWRGSHERSVMLPDADIMDADRLIRLTQQVVDRRRPPRANASSSAAPPFTSCASAPDTLLPLSLRPARLQIPARPGRGQE